MVTDAHADWRSNKVKVKRPSARLWLSPLHHIAGSELATAHGCLSLCDWYAAAPNRCSSAPAWRCCSQRTGGTEKNREISSGSTCAFKCNFQWTMPSKVESAALKCSKLVYVRKKKTRERVENNTNCSEKWMHPLKYFYMFCPKATKHGAVKVKN